MKFAFLIFKYFPYGGVQRDMLRIAKDCVTLGHQVTIFTGEWQGPQPANIQVKLCASNGWRNHTKHASLISAMQQAVQAESFDLVVGFNRMQPIDVYFAADSCFIAKAHEERPWWYRLTSRYRWFQQAEASIFSPASKTHILTLTPQEQSTFQHWYNTPNERFHLIPPILDPQRFPHFDRAQRKQWLADTFGILPEHIALLLVGSGFKTKGADRAVSAIAALPEHFKSTVRMLIIGQDNPRWLQKHIEAQGLSNLVQVLGGRDDIPQLMQACDWLVHPARRELAGHVLLEAMASGLPVLTTAVCGYAPHISKAGAGLALPSPFDQEALNKALAKALSSERERFSQAGLTYAAELMHNNPGKAEAQILTQLASGNSLSEQSLRAEPLTRKTQLWLSPKHAQALQRYSFEDFMALQGYTVRAAANRKTMRINIDGHSYFIKQHKATGWREIAKNWLAFKRPIIGAMTEVRAIQALENLGIATTPIAAYGIQGHCAASQRSFLLTEDLGDIHSLEDICKSWQSQPAAAETRQAMLIAVAKLAKKFHGAGLCHRDFYLCHIALQKNATLSADTAFYLLDLHRVLHGVSPHGTEVRKDIAGLIFSCMDFGFTREDWQVFKAHYLPQSDDFWAKAFERGDRLHAKFHSPKQQTKYKQQREATDL
ncbi:MAG: lipopolysaccharide core heptose(I) kinase RfaP [Methylophilus sp.]